MNDNKKKDDFAMPKHDSYTITIAGDEKLKPVDNGDNERIMTVPAMPLAGIVIFPFALSPLMLNDDKAIRTVENAVSNERFVAISPKCRTTRTRSRNSRTGSSCYIRSA